jgi:hypothetical protein
VPTFGVIVIFKFPSVLFIGWFLVDAIVPAWCTRANANL